MNISSGSNDWIRRRMRRLEREFESKGYQVLVEPEADKLPKFLVGYLPNPQTRRNRDRGNLLNFPPG